MQNKKSWLVGLSAVAILAFAPLVAHATPPEDNVYVNCSTGVSPFTPTTVTSGKSQEVQVTCNAGDVALGGGVEVVNPPLPLDAPVIAFTQRPRIRSCSQHNSGRLAGGATKHLD